MPSSLKWFSPRALLLSHPSAATSLQKQDMGQDYCHLPLYLPSREFEDGAASSGYISSIYGTHVMHWFCVWPLLGIFIIKIQVGTIHSENMVLLTHMRQLEGHVQRRAAGALLRRPAEPPAPVWLWPEALIATTPAPRLHQSYCFLSSHLTNIHQASEMSRSLC